MPGSQKTMDEMVDEVFELTKLIYAARSRLPSGPDQLSETEFLTLDLLAKEECLTIGAIQRSVGVVPAQMSRIVRALEEQGGRGFVECRINPKDRRRVNVVLTDAGRKAYEAYRAARLKTMYDALSVLAPEDRMEFMRMMRTIRGAFEQRLGLC
ncbi:MAG: MarR family winged helix-turn-helix transcriptional regulator [Phycisphaerae bacterium]